MKVKTDLFAHVGVVKSQELSGNVTHEMLYEFPSYWLERTSGKSNFKIIKWLPYYIYWLFYIAFKKLT